MCLIIGTGGAWDEVGKSNKSSSSNNTGSVNSTSSTNKQSHSSQNQAKRTNKEAEDSFLKLFQDHGVNMSKHQSPSHGQSHSQSQPVPGDEFTRWCYETVQVIGGGNVDVPTFISFLKEVESPFEVNDYIR